MFYIHLGFYDRTIAFLIIFARNYGLELTKIEVFTSEAEQKIRDDLEASGMVHFTFENPVDFTVLVYALYKAKYLNNGEGEITKIHNELAKLLNITLPKNWSSNLSKMIHRNNYDYKPKILENISKAFEQYRDELSGK
ncbi:MAG: RteC domain-containing protein [Bacteroidota bacterium]